MADYLIDPLNEKLVLSWILHFDFDILVPSTPPQNVPVGETYQMDDLEPIFVKMTVHQKYFFTRKLCAS